MLECVAMRVKDESSEYLMHRMACGKRGEEGVFLAVPTSGDDFLMCCTGFGAGNEFHSGRTELQVVYTGTDLRKDRVQ